VERASSARPSSPSQSQQRGRDVQEEGRVAERPRHLQGHVEVGNRRLLVASGLRDGHRYISLMHRADLTSDCAALFNWAGTP
jgi:hypothetical protein